MKLIAYDIINLTDARYYAARGACMIGFSTMLSSVEQVNAIKDWVDVPDFFLHLPPQASAEDIWEWQERTGISTFLVSAISEDTMAMFPQTKWITFHSDQSDVDMERSHIFIHADNLDSWRTENEDIEEVEVYVDYLANLNGELNELDFITGVLIKGTSEDKVGLKSFEAIDEYLDSIEIEY